MSKTDLIERYLNAVKFWLPGKQQKDILAELSEDLHAQIDDRESALGRPLNEDELVALLKKRGSPMRLAGGYLPEQRLVSPGMMPIYRLVLKILLPWAVIPVFSALFIAPLFDAANTAGSLWWTIGNSIRTLFFMIGIITTAFALVDRYHTKWIDRWDPRKLPRVPPAQPRMQWYNDFAAFAFGMAGFFFWAVTMWNRTVFVFEGGFHITPGAIWGQLYWPILGVTLARAVVDLYCFMRRDWTRGQSWVRIALDGAAMAVAAVCLRGGSWVDMSSPTLAAADVAKLVSMVNHLVRVSLVFALAIAVVDVIKHGRLLYRSKNAQTAAILTVS
jgi:hypothetical protein